MNPATLAAIMRLLDVRWELTLATVRADGSPQANVVNFARDGTTLYIATNRHSQKVLNLQHCDKVALALSDDYDDWASVRGLSIDGIADVLPDDSAETWHAKDRLARRFVDAGRAPSPDDPATTVYLRIVPTRICLIDYSKGYGHRETIILRAS